MALFEVTANDRRIYEEELRDFLPEKILDVHTHVWLDQYRDDKTAADETDRAVLWPTLVANDNSIEDLQETYRLLLPGKDVSALIFPGGGGSEANNDYVGRCGKATGWPALYYSSPDQSADEVEAKIRAGGFLGLKSYLNKSPKYLPEAEVRILAFFPKHQLKRLEEMGGIIMLHIPRPKRLKDPVNLAQLQEIMAEFPKLKLILAHVGRAYTQQDIGDAFDILDTMPNLYYDFSANCCEAAITEVLRHAGTKHVMYGTDMPILRMRTHRIEENGTYINLVPPGMYGDPSQDPHLREVSPEEAEKITFFLYEELLAFKRACTTLNLSRQDVEDVMYNNAAALVESARRSIYGA